MIERPELIQAHRSHRNEHLLFKAIVGCLIGLTAVIALATHSHAATTEVGIAPPVLPSTKYVFFDRRGRNGRDKIKIEDHYFGAEK